MQPGVTTLRKKTIYAHFLMDLKFINPTNIFSTENGFIFKIGSTTSFLKDASQNNTELNASLGDGAHKRKCSKG